MSGILQEEWALIVWAVLAVSLNIYLMKEGRYRMGLFILKYKDLIEAVNWLLLVGVIMYISYLHTWFFLLSFFVFPVAGLIVSSVFRSYTQLLYMIGMPVFTILGIIHMIQR